MEPGKERWTCLSGAWQVGGGLSSAPTNGGQVWSVLSVTGPRRGGRASQSLSLLLFFSLSWDLSLYVNKPGSLLVNVSPVPPAAGQQSPLADPSLATDTQQSPVEVTRTAQQNLVYQPTE